MGLILGAAPGTAQQVRGGASGKGGEEGMGQGMREGVGGPSSQMMAPQGMGQVA